MTVENYVNFLNEQVDNLKKYIAFSSSTSQWTNQGYDWPLIAHVAKEAKYAIIAFVESELQRQISTHTTSEEIWDMKTNNNAGTLSSKIINTKQIDLTDGTNYNNPYSRCSLNNVRTSLFKLAQVIKPLFIPADSTSDKKKGIIGAWHRSNIDVVGYNSFGGPPYIRYKNFPGHGSDMCYIDQWYFSLSYWLYAFLTGFHFVSFGYLGGVDTAEFTSEMQVKALTNGEVDFEVWNTTSTGSPAYK